MQNETVTIRVSDVQRFGLNIAYYLAAYNKLLKQYPDDTHNEIIRRLADTYCLGLGYGVDFFNKVKDMLGRAEEKPECREVAVLPPTIGQTELLPDIKPVRKQRARDPIFDMLMEVCGSDGNLTAHARGIYNKAAKQLRDVGATAEQVKERAEKYKIVFNYMSLTPLSLVKHWDRCSDNAMMIEGERLTGKTILAGKAKDYVQEQKLDNIVERMSIQAEDR